MTQRRRDLSNLVIDAFDDRTWSPLPVERWVIESARPMQSLQAWPWPDIDPAELNWAFNDHGVRCAIVEDADWPYKRNERNDYPSLTDGLFRRPLLPHETSCDDVFEWRAELAYARSITLTPGGLTPSG